MHRIRVALCQLNLTVGDLDGNVEKALACLGEADEAGCDVAVFPELCVTGYPPEDLLLKPRFVADARAAVEKVAARTSRCAAVIGYPDGDGPLYNGAALCAGGEVVGTYHKRHLPNYGVFDEKRYFAAGREALRLWSLGGVRVGMSICEDVWIAGGPVNELAAGGAQLILNINASPHHIDKDDERLGILQTRALETGVPIVYVNLVGGQDELVFDGGSLVVDGTGRVVARAPQFSETTLIVDLEVPDLELPPSSYPVLDVTAPVGYEREWLRPEPAEPLEPLAEIYEALVIGTHDYVRKNGFDTVCIGLSGGVDSSLVAAVAADALGADHVHGILMPSRFSSDHSRTDAARLADNLGIHRREIPIEAAHGAFLEMLAPAFAGLDSDVTEENLQSRIRGVLLMALANKFGWLVLTTGNKSELAVGYSTLYGDTAGAFSVIKDVWKLTVYELCRYRNRRGETPVIPERVLVKAPSAELRPDQRDDQSLPPYEVLDPILQALVEHDRTAAELVADGLDPQVVARMARLVDIAEYKRRQSPLGPRISTKAFGRDRRMPVTNAYRGLARD